MSAEEMRNDLETFVNQGLSEGWCGWPTKGMAPRQARPIAVNAYDWSAKPILGYGYPRQRVVAGMGQAGGYGGLN